MKYARGSFIVVPSREVLRGMPVAAQALYMWLCAYANDTGECFPSRARLAKDCNCSLNTIDRFTKLLEDRGLLKIEKRFKNNEQITNLYTLMIVEGGSPTDEPPSPTDEQGVAPQMNTELNPILTQSTYQGVAAAPRESSFDKKEWVLRAVTESGDHIKTRGGSKYPHAKEVFSWFDNPEKSWNLNTTELKHAELLWERGESKVKGALKFVKRHLGDEFCPKVTKPSDLERKWSDIVVYAERNNG